MNIVIADDNDVALLILEHSLAQAGHEVRCVSDGREAMEALSDGQCRIIIADWEMPEMDGLELCRAVRNAGLPGYVFFMLLTGRGSRHDKLHALSAGVDDFITKPFDEAELVAKLRNAERLLSLETRELTIFALAKLAESRDPETGSHLERVRNYTRLIAQQLALRPEYAGKVTGSFVRTIYETSPLHDIGKVAIPDCVLLKPGRLNDQEFDIMKTHTTLGAQTLQAALKQHPGAEFLQMASQIALTHHERFDGSGYPSGLQGTDIPLCGRIMAVADVYDAMTSKRVYKPAFDHIVASSTIREGAGRHFDPVLVEVFLSLERQFCEIRAALDEAPPLAA
jgi:putative two-component system response regulator